MKLTARVQVRASCEAAQLARGRAGMNDQVTALHRGAYIPGMYLGLIALFSLGYLRSGGHALGSGIGWHPRSSLCQPLSFFTFWAVTMVYLTISAVLDLRGQGTWLEYALLAIMKVPESIIAHMITVP